MSESLLLNAHNPGPMTGGGNNTYLLTAGNGSAILIDAGVGRPEHLADLNRALEASRSRLDTVVVTHSHPDHASGAPAIATAHPSAAFLKYPHAEEDSRYLLAWRALADGDRIGTGEDALTVVYTPGHSPDHVALWHEATRMMYTGDLVVRGRTVMIHASRGGNLRQYLDSLRRVLELKPRRLLPAHGPRVDDPAALLTEYLEHRRMREEQILTALDRGHATVEAIVDSVYHGLVPALVPAARETVRAHLEKLRADGMAVDEHGQWRRVS